jgi:hypothetical protein
METNDKKYIIESIVKEKYSEYPNFLKIRNLQQRIDRLEENEELLNNYFKKNSK